MEKEEIIDKFTEFLREYYYNELVSAMSESRKFITVDFSLLDKFDPDLADYLAENPEEVLPLAEDSTRQIDLPGEPKLKLQFVNLPENKQIRIRILRAEHIGKLISVDGIVKRASEVRPEVSEVAFQCGDCGNKITIIQTERFIRPPIECDCGNRKTFKQIDQKLYDARWVMIEEAPEITSGERPSDIRIFFKEDLTSPRMQSKTDPGNRIKVVGVLKQLQKRIKGTNSRQLDIYVDANSVENLEVEWEELDITSEDQKKMFELAADPEIYNKLVGSIGPSLYGMDEIKEGIALQLFGGEVHIQKDKSRVRGDIHILLVGDPSCLVADERVVMADGTIMKIGEMGSNHLQKINYRIHTGMGRDVGRADTFHVYKKQPIIEVITESGKSIKGSYNQPLLVVKNRNKSWKRLDEIKIGDRVQVLPRIECRKKTLVKTNWTDFSYYHKSWHINIPKIVDEKLAGLFGYILADGWVEKRRIGFVVNDDESDITPKLEEYFKECFDALVTSYKHPSASKKITYYQVNRTHLAKLLSFLNEKRVPNVIFQSGNSVVASFLRWLYEGDGTVFSKGRGRTSVSLKSNNIELLRDVQVLLLRFGIHSRISWDERKKITKIKGREIVSNPSGSLMIRRSESIIKFWQSIGYISKKKSDKLKNTVEYARNHIRRVHKSRTEKIVKISKLPPQDVFDIEVPKHHRFVANGIIVHNTAKSVLMKVVSGLIPRGRYVSGKGVTGAGLTATVVKDEEFLGGWVLEAGALVMCNRSLLAIDEFEKIEKTDQVALHEAMEQNTISIAKANIVATLPAQTAILGGGNPKLGRFDPYMPIREQIDVPETLLSRFDLKFALRDRPGAEIDRKVADHILKARHYGEEEIVPAIPSDFLKKYIAYARKNCHPKLLREAGELIKEFFVGLRERVASEEAPVPITLRQYEALIRLAEAAAKVQLRNEVVKEDAIRAINLMKASLRQFGFEPETGKIDIDRVEGHISSAQRSRIRIVLDIIGDLTVSLGKNVPKDEIVKRARDQGIDEFSIEKILNELKSNGTLFEPRVGMLQKV
jgi:DNA replicative helicase MCM subunit Mcm2 (Cdc46/Mcm family)